MNSKPNYNIYEISQQIQEERLKIYQEEARQIANAYRKVQQIKVEKLPTTNKPQQQAQQYKPTSTYAMKVKETLKQLNSTKAKQCKGVIKPSVNLPHQRQHKQLQKLFNVALTRIYSIIQDHSSHLFKSSWQSLVKYSVKDKQMQDSFIIKFRRFRIFRAWKEEIILVKIQKSNKITDQTDLKAVQLVSQFRSFNLIKKSFSFWCSYAKRQIKRKQYQKQLIKKEFKAKIQQKSQPPKTTIKQNQELQSKVRNFVGKLKQQIENKDRLITIKQNTEQSQLHLKMPNAQEEKTEEKEHSLDANSNANIEDEAQQNEQIVITPPKYGENAKSSKQMTNQQLQKKRRQLQLKHKSRKDALEKLRKQKDQKKKEEELLRMELQKEVQAEQKRLKQEKYKGYLKNKKEQEEWQLKQKQLEAKAQQFNQFRLKKYYGWLPLFNSKTIIRENVLFLYQTILAIVYRINSQTFIRNAHQSSSQLLESKYQKMDRIYKLKLLKKGFSSFSSNKITSLQLKEQLMIRHQVNLLKIFLSAWKRSLPLLRDENLDWQLPRSKKADQFYRIQLLYKGTKALRQNKHIEQRERIINQQKLKIKNKIKNMLEDEGQLNYEQFL